MRKILEDFYFGNIVPYDKRMAANSELYVKSYAHSSKTALL